MAKPRPKSKACRWRYTFYRIFIYEGPNRLKREELWYVDSFLRKYGVDKEDRKRRNDVAAAYCNKFIDMMDAIPLYLRPHRVELITPVGRVVRRWSRVRSWNIPVPMPDGSVPVWTETDSEKMEASFELTFEGGREDAEESSEGGTSAGV